MATEGNPLYAPEWAEVSKDHHGDVSNWYVYMFGCFVWKPFNDCQGGLQICDIFYCRTTSARKQRMTTRRMRSRNRNPSQLQRCRSDPLMRSRRRMWSLILRSQRSKRKTCFLILIARADERSSQWHGDGMESVRDILIIWDVIPQKLGSLMTLELSDAKKVRRLQSKSSRLWYLPMLVFARQGPALRSWALPGNDCLGNDCLFG